MKKTTMTTIMMTLLGLLLMATTAQAGSFKAITSATTSGDTSGGLRYDFENGTVVDGGITKDSTSGTQFWVDAYHSYWGVYAAGTSKEITSMAFMFAVEQPVTDKIAIGIGTKLINRNSAEEIEYFKSWDAYLVLAI